MVNAPVQKHGRLPCSDMDPIFASIGRRPAIASPFNGRCAFQGEPRLDLAQATSKTNLLKIAYTSKEKGLRFCHPQTCDSPLKTVLYDAGWQELRVLGLPLVQHLLRYAVPKTHSARGPKWWLFACQVGI